jgi:hypothetical protein
MDRANGISQEKAGWITKMLYRAFKKRMGLIPRSKTLTAYDTPTLLATSWMDANVAAAKTVSPRLKELAQLKAAILAGCPF